MMTPQDLTASLIHLLVLTAPMSLEEVHNVKGVSANMQNLGRGYKVGSSEMRERHVRSVETGVDVKS